MHARMQALPSVEQMEAIAERWRPYRSLGSYYMWRVAEAAPRAPKKSKSMPVGVTV
jgi:DNA-3-methyladenine glycosylase II